MKFAAGSNSVTAATISINTGSSGQTANGTVTLGGGTNIFHANTFNIAAGRQSTPVSFPGSTGGLRIRGTGGTDEDLSNMTLGNHNTSGSGSTAAGTLALDGHPVDLRFGTLTLGRGDSSPTGNSPGNGTLSFVTGTVFANTINMAVSAGSRRLYWPTARTTWVREPHSLSALVGFRWQTRALPRVPPTAF